MSLKDMRGGLRSYLLADSAISTAIGAVRIHGVKLPSGVMAGPSIVYNLISEETDHHMQGPSGLVFARMQLDAWAATIDLAQNLALLIKSRLDGYRGPMEYGTNSPRDFVTVQGIFSENALFDYDAAANLHRASRDYFIDYGER